MNELEKKKIVVVCALFYGFVEKINNSRIG